MTRRKIENMEVVHRYTCPRGCGWHRDYRTDLDWMGQIAHHQLYGPVKEFDLVQRDIAEHDCIEFYNARLRLRRKQMQHEQVAA